MGAGLSLLAGTSIALASITLVPAQIIIEPAPSPIDKPQQDRIFPGNRVPDTARPETGTPQAAPPVVSPGTSVARLMLLNDSVKVENRAGVALELMPNLQVDAG